MRKAILTVTAILTIASALIYLNNYSGEQAKEDNIKEFIKYENRYDSILKPIVTERNKLALDLNITKNNNDRLTYLLELESIKRDSLIKDIKNTFPKIAAKIYK